MNYIIDPRTIYWLNTVGGIKFASVVFAIVGFIAFIIYFNFNYDEPKSKPTIILLGVVTVICLLCAIFTPSKQTIIEMEVARICTYENVGNAVDFTVDTVKDIAEYIAGLLNSGGQ